MPIACQPYYTVRERLRTLLSGVSKPQLTNLSLPTIRYSRFTRSGFTRSGSTSRRCSATFIPH